jgi:integrase
MSCYPEKRKGRTTGVWIAEAFLPGVGRVRKRCQTFAEGERWADTVTLTGRVPEGSLPSKAAATGDQVTIGRVASEAKAAGGPRGTWKSGRDRSGLQRLERVVYLLGHDAPITSVTTARLDALVATVSQQRTPHGTVSAGTVNRHLSAVSALLRFACSRGYLPAVPVIPWARETGKRLLWLTHADEAKLCRVLEDQGRPWVALCVRVLCATGMRWGELAGLEPAQVEDEWIRLWQTKTNRPRSVPIAQPMARELRGMIAAGQLPGTSTMSNRFRDAVKSAGLQAGLCVHSCRHTTATRLVQAGVPLPTVMTFLGHSSIETTMRYAHLNDQSLVQAAQYLSPHAGQNDLKAALRVVSSSE